MVLRRSLLSIAPAASMILALTPVAAHADLIPAPPAQASGVAAQVGSLLDISKTDATAGGGASSAQASVIRVGGEPLLGLGGAQTGEGDSGGSLLDTGSSLPAQVQLAPWRAGTHTSGQTRQSKSSAAVAKAVVPSVAGVGVLTSDSQASWTGQKSNGTAVTDGFQLDLLDALRLVLLHSEVTSDGRGHSYLAGVNGTEIGTDDQLGSSPLCAASAAELVNLSCLTASGGNGANGDLTSGAAQVAQIDPALAVLGAVDPVATFTATSSSGTGRPDLSAPAAPTPDVSIDASRSAAPAAVAGAVETARSAGALPRTGMPAGPLAGVAVALVVFGLGLRRVGVPRLAR